MIAQHRRLTFAALHFVGLKSVRFMLWDNGGSGGRRAQFFQLPFRAADRLHCLAVIVGVSHAIAFYHESQQRKRTAHLET